MFSGNELQSPEKYEKDQTISKKNEATVRIHMYVGDLETKFYKVADVYNKGMKKDVFITDVDVFTNNSLYHNLAENVQPNSKDIALRAIVFCLSKMKLATF